MPDEQLKIGISGDAGGLQKASQVAVSSLNKIDKAAIQSASSLSQIPKVSQQVSQAAATMARSAATAGGAIAKTTTNFTGLSRVIQDLPFGFVAISNNLEQLLPAAGAAGLAFSAIVSAMTFASVGFGAWTRGMGGVTKENEKAQKELEATKERIADLTRAFSDIKIGVNAEVTGDTSAEIIKVQALSKVVSDVTKSYGERNRALNELKDINKNYFGDLTLESDKLSTLTSRVDEYTKALVAASVVKAFSDEIGKVGKEFSIQNEKLRDLSTQLNAIAGDYQLLGKQTKGVRLLTPEQNVQAEKLRTQIKQQQGFVADLGNTYKKLQQQIESAVLETLKFKPLEAPTKPGKEKKDDTFEKELEEKKRILTEFQKDFENINIKFPDLSKRLEDFKIPELKTELNDKLNDALTGLLLPGQITENKPIDIKIPIHPQVIVPIDQAIIDAQKKMKELSDAITKTMQSIATEAFASIGDALGAALTGGDIGKVFDALFSFIGSAIQQLGQQMIVLSPIIVALKAAIKTLNPAVLLPAGIALVAIGSVLKNIHPKGFALGGLVSGPTLGLVGEGIGTSRSNPEVIAPLNKLKQFIQPAPERVAMPPGQWKIRGKDLVYVHDQTRKSQRRAF